MLFYNKKQNMKIGIELNGVVRDLNKQIVKYYKKDINKEFDDKSVDYNVLNVANEIKWSNKLKNEFLYVDYPYEVYGCAKAMESNLPVTINNHVKIFEDDDVELCLFSLFEEGLTIQSTYFFLSKIGSRVREMYFPHDSATMWDKCDVIITTSRRIVETRPDGKVVILIKKSDNASLESKADYAYDSLMDFFNDKETINKIISNEHKSSNCNFIGRIKKWFRR